MSTKNYQWQGASFAATIAATAGTPGAVMTVTGIGQGSLAAGQNVVGVTPANNTIASQLTGPVGGTGTYQLQTVSQTPFTSVATGATYTTMGATSSALFGAAGSTGTTGTSNFLGSAPYDVATVMAWINPGSTGSPTASVEVLGSLDGGLHSTVLTTLLLTGASATQAYVLPAPYNSYNSIALDITAIAGNNTQVGGQVRYASKAPTSN